MKKFLIVVLIIILLGAGGIAYIAVHGTALDKESKAYAEATVPAIITNWREKELLDRASPELKKAADQQQFDRMFRWFSSLGHLQKSDPLQGGAIVSATSQAGNQITAQYHTKATFEKGEATVTLGLIKHGDQWEVLRFNVNSPQLAPK